MAQLVQTTFGKLAENQEFIFFGNSATSIVWTKKGNGCISKERKLVFNIVPIDASVITTNETINA